MSRPDVYHDAVHRALEKDGWTITHDPLTLSVGGRDIFVDLRAEQPIAAEKQGRKIAVEVKSFLGPSPVHDLERAIGQFVFYRNLLQSQEPERRLYLAIRDTTLRGSFRNRWASWAPVHSEFRSWYLFPRKRSSSNGSNRRICRHHPACDRALCSIQARLG